MKKSNKLLGARPYVSNGKLYFGRGAQKPKVSDTKIYFGGKIRKRKNKSMSKKRKLTGEGLGTLAAGLANKLVGSLLSILAWDVKKNYVMRKRATPKQVTLPNGRTFVARYERVPRSELPASIRMKEHIEEELHKVNSVNVNKEVEV